MAVPTPYDATTGAKISASAFDVGVRDALTFLLDGFPRCHVFDSTGNAFVNTNNKLILWDSEQYDTDTMHSTSSLTSRIVFTTAGLYDIDVAVTMPSATYSVMLLNIRQNSGGSGSGGTSLRNKFFDVGAAASANACDRFLRTFAAGDYLEFFLNQTSGATRTNVVGLYASRVFATWMAKT